MAAMGPLQLSRHDIPDVDISSWRYIAPIAAMSSALTRAARGVAAAGAACDNRGDDLDPPLGRAADLLPVRRRRRRPELVALPADELPSVAELFTFMRDAELRFDTLRMRIEERIVRRRRRAVSS